MMGRALLIIGALAALGFVASGVLGYLLGGPADAALMRHVIAAQAACLAQLFAHSWILVYLVMTGRAIRTAVAEHGLEKFYGEEVSRFKKVALPWLFAASGLGVATFLVGGAAVTGASRPWLHHLLAWLTLAAQVGALWQERRVLRANQALIDEIDGRTAPAAGAVLAGHEVAG